MIRTATRLLPAAAALLLAITPAISAAAIYKWVDQQGNVHYGSNPPAGQPAQTIQPPPPPPAGSAQETKQLNKAVKAADAERAKQNKAQQKAAKEAARKKTMEANCRKARTQINMLHNRHRIQVVSGGAIHTMTTQERASATTKIQNYINKNCKNF